MESHDVEMQDAAAFTRSNGVPAGAADASAETGPATSEQTDLLRGSFRPTELIQTTTLQKLNWRVLPFTSLIVMLSYMDRGNLGFVAADVCNELKINHAGYGIGVGLFGFGYVLSQVPSNYLIRICGPTLWFAILMVVWGAVASTFSIVQNRLEFYLLRFALGFAEGGTFPGVWYYLTTFYPPMHLTYPYATIEASISISTPLAASIAAGLISLYGFLGFEGWRLLFFVEGLVPIIFGGILYWLLPSSPDQASYLKKEEKEWIRSQQEEDGTSERHILREMAIVLSHRDFWIINVSGLLRGVLLTAAFYWTTLLIAHMLHEGDDEDSDTCAPTDSTSIASVALTAVPFTTCTVLSLFFGYAAAGVRNRPVLAGSIIGVSGVFLVGWVIFRNISFALALISLSLGISCFLVPNAVLVGMVGSYFDKEARATSLALFNSIAGIGMSVGPIVIGYLVDWHGYGIVVTLLGALAILSGGLLFLVRDPLLSQKMNFVGDSNDEDVHIS